MATRERRTLKGMHCALVGDLVMRAEMLGLPPDFVEDLRLSLQVAQLQEASCKAGHAMTDAGELTPHVVRLLRDFERRVPGVLARLYEWAERVGYVDCKHAA